jgi:hypothetical protein
MTKHLYKTLTLILLTVCFSASFSFGQTKGGKRKTKESSEVVARPVERMGVPVEDPAAAERAYKVSKDTYVFLVLVNQTSESVQAVNDLSSQFPGTRVEPLPGSGNMAYVVKSRNPSMAMFQRAYGTTLQIFTEGDLQLYAGSIPAFAQLKEQLSLMSAKLGDL